MDMSSVLSRMMSLYVDKIKYHSTQNLPSNETEKAKEIMENNILCIKYQFYLVKDFHSMYKIYLVI